MPLNQEIKESVAMDPAKEKQQKQVAIALVIVLVPLLLWNLTRYKRAVSYRQKLQTTSSYPTAGQASEGHHDVSSTSTPQTAPEPSASPSDLAQYENTLVWKRDPFTLGIAQDGKGPTLQLKVSGIIYDEVRPEATYAIISQEVVRIGDSIQGIKVIDIQPDYVRLKKFNQELILYLYQEEEKK